jgi:hypothetical protein
VDYATYSTRKSHGFRKRNVSSSTLRHEWRTSHAKSRILRTTRTPATRPNNITYITHKVKNLRNIISDLLHHTTYREHHFLLTQHQCQNTLMSCHNVALNYQSPYTYATNHYQRACRKTKNAPSFIAGISLPVSQTIYRSYPTLRKTVPQLPRPQASCRDPHDPSSYTLHASALYT